MSPDHFSIEETSIPDVLRVQKRKAGDNRGHFSRLFCQDELNAAGISFHPVQINHSFSKSKGTLRGMHFQKAPSTEMKFVSCLKGAVFDVALDLRESSPTVGHWTSEVLSAQNWVSLLIPAGVAHGFQALSNDVELVYVHSAPYQPELEAGVNALDEYVGIEWPCRINEMSERDRNLPGLRSL